MSDHVADSAISAESFNAPDTAPDRPETPAFKGNVPLDTGIIRAVSQIDFVSAIAAMGLVSVKEMDPSIHVDLRYATTRNFMGVNVYGHLTQAYLQPDIAEKLKLAQQFLKSKLPGYSLIVFDATRPRRVQAAMWNAVQLPAAEKGKFISGPTNGSLHNYGAAVDLSIVDDTGAEIDMGTPYDFLGELAYPRLEQQMLDSGKLSQTQISNRKLLREVMQKAGFSPITTEWWHFNACTRTEAKNRYMIVE